MRLHVLVPLEPDEEEMLPQTWELNKEDKNDTYGTYSKGWNGKGDYGDGDKVYVTDTNVYMDPDQVGKTVIHFVYMNSFHMII